MIGSHPTPDGGSTMRRDERPTKRINPGGAVRWLARWTDNTGRRRHGWREQGIPGAHEKCGPCRETDGGGTCCAQHAIYRCYELDAGEQESRERLTVRGYFEGEWLKRHPRGDRTEQAYKSRIRAMLELKTQDGKFGDVQLRVLRPRHLDDLVDVMLREHGRAAQGTRAVIRALSAMIKDAIRDDLMEMNPATLVTIRDNDPRVQRATRKPIIASWEEMHAFAIAAGEHEPMVRVLADCGLRLGEMLGLDCRHVQGDVLVVEQHAWHGVNEPGTKQGDSREVPLPPRLASLLALAKRDRIGPLFPNRDGRVWSESAFYRYVWAPAQRASGMALLPHDLRHSYVSLMRAAGVDPADLAVAAGHTVATATARYTHSTGSTFEAMRKAVG